MRLKDPKIHDEPDTINLKLTFGRDNVKDDDRKQTAPGGFEGIGRKFLSGE